MTGVSRYGEKFLAVFVETGPRGQRISAVMPASRKATPSWTDATANRARPIP